MIPEALLTPSVFGDCAVAMMFQRHAPDGDACVLQDACLAVGVPMPPPLSVLHPLREDEALPAFSTYLWIQRLGSITNSATTSLTLALVAAGAMPPLRNVTGDEVLNAWNNGIVLWGRRADEAWPHRDIPWQDVVCIGDVAVSHQEMLRVRFTYRESVLRQILRERDLAQRERRDADEAFRMAGWEVVRVALPPGAATVRVARHTLPQTSILRAAPFDATTEVRMQQDSLPVVSLHDCRWAFDPVERRVYDLRDYTVQAPDYTPALAWREWLATLPVLESMRLSRIPPWGERDRWDRALEHGATRHRHDDQIDALRYLMGPRR